MLRVSAEDPNTTGSRNARRIGRRNTRMNGRRYYHFNREDEVY